MDVRVLDKEGNPIEIKNNDDEDMRASFRDQSYYQSSDDEITDAGYSIEDIEDHLDDMDDEEDLPEGLNSLIAAIAEADDDFEGGFDGMDEEE